MNTCMIVSESIYVGLSLARGEGEGRKNTSGDYSTVFVSPAGIYGSPMKLQQPCDIAECYVTCTQQGQR